MLTVGCELEFKRNARLWVTLKYTLGACMNMEKKLTSPITMRDLDKISRIRLKEVIYRIDNNNIDYVNEYIYTYTPKNNKFEMETFVEHYRDNQPEEKYKEYHGTTPYYVCKQQILDMLNHLLDKDSELYKYRNPNIKSIYVTYLDEKLKGKRTRAPTKKCPIKLDYRRMI